LDDALSDEGRMSLGFEARVEDDPRRRWVVVLRVVLDSMIVSWLLFFVND